MPFNFFRFFVDLAIESYVLSVLFFGVLNKGLASLFQRKYDFERGLNLIGLGLALLALLDEINDFLLIPANNYEIHWRENPYWHFFRLISILGFLLAVLVFVNGKRLKSSMWIFMGTLLLIIPELARPIEECLVQKYYGGSGRLPFQPFSFWWLNLLTSGVMLFGVFMFARKRA